MASDINFAGENVRVKVEEDPDQVAEAFQSAQGLPFSLTLYGRQGNVYINPATVAFWSPADPTSEPASQQESPSPRAERPVTNIWGQPLRRKRRR